MDSGELDIATAPASRAFARENHEDADAALIVDLADVAFICSGGLYTAADGEAIIGRSHSSPRSFAVLLVAANIAADGCHNVGGQGTALPPKRGPVLAGDVIPLR